MSEARECFTRSVNITHAMAHRVIKVSQRGGKAKAANGHVHLSSSQVVHTGEQENVGRKLF